MAENTALKINTRIVKFLVLAIVLCGVVGILIYLADVDFGTATTTVSPPVIPTLSTERATFQVMFDPGEITGLESSLPWTSESTTTEEEMVTSTIYTQSTTSPEPNPWFFTVLKDPMVQRGRVVKSYQHCQSLCLQLDCGFIIMADYNESISNYCHMGFFDKGRFVLTGYFDAFVNDKAMANWVNQELRIVSTQMSFLQAHVKEVSWQASEKKCQMACLSNQDTCNLVYWDGVKCYIGFLDKPAHDHAMTNNQSVDISLVASRIPSHPLGFFSHQIPRDFSKVSFQISDIDFEACNQVAYFAQADYFVHDNLKCSYGFLQAHWEDLPLAEEQSVFINLKGDPLKYFNVLTLSYKVEPIVGSNWVLEEMTRSNLEFCSSVCYMKGKDGCNMFMFHENKCYFQKENSFQANELGFKDDNGTSNVHFLDDNLKLSDDFLMRSSLTSLDSLTGDAQAFLADSINACKLGCLLENHFKNGSACDAFVFWPPNQCFHFQNLPVIIGPDDADYLSLNANNDSNFGYPIRDVSKVKEENTKIQSSHYSAWNCPPRLQYMVGNGLCDDESNIEECNWDAYECCNIVIQRGQCISCQCHTSGQTQFDIDRDLGCRLIHSGLNYLDDGVCNQNNNYENCIMFDAGDCCDPRSERDNVVYSELVTYNDQCHLPENPNVNVMTKYMYHWLTGEWNPKIRLDYSHIAYEDKLDEYKEQDFPNDLARDIERGPYGRFSNGEMGPRLLSIYAGQRYVNVNTRDFRQHAAGNRVALALRSRRKWNDIFYWYEFGAGNYTYL